MCRASITVWTCFGPDVCTHAPVRAFGPVRTFSACRAVCSRLSVVSSFAVVTFRPISGSRSAVVPDVHSLHRLRFHRLRAHQLGSVHGHLGSICTYDR